MELLHSPLAKRLGGAAFLGIIGSAAFGAFSTKTANAIWNRAQGKGEESGKCRQAGYTMERIHFSHQRGPNYDLPSNGFLDTSGLHYLIHQNLAGLTGLPPAQDLWAMEQIYGRISEKERIELKMAGAFDGSSGAKIWVDKKVDCVDCPARIDYPLGIQGSLIKMANMCIVQRMMETGTTAEGVRDFYNKLPPGQGCLECPLKPAILKYIGS